MRRKPNLFIIGAMKSGTSSLYRYLGDHPEIYMSKVKEPMHFSREENWARRGREYLDLFLEAGEEAYLGEGSTEYTKKPFREGVAKRLYEFDPQARLIYIMRDPFERIISQYKHMLKSGREERPLREAIKKSSDYLTNSYYAYQLRPYLELFGSEAMFVDTFEALVASPEDFCRRVFRWLSIDETFVPSNRNHAFHVSPSRFRLIDDSAFIGKFAVRLNRFSIMRQMLPRFARKWILNILPTKIDMNFSSADFEAEVAVTRDAVSPILCGWVEELEQLTGLSYRIWPTHATRVNYPPSPSAFTEEINKYLELLMGKASPVSSLTSGRLR